MGLSESLVFYVLIGLGVAAAVWLSAEERAGSQRWFSTASAVLFWPIYVPLLLSPTTEQAVPQPTSYEPHADCLATMIAHVQTELDAALAGRDGWAEEALSRERTRIDELKSSWSLQAARIREMDRVLEQSHTAAGDLHMLPGRSEQARQENLERLAAIRGQAMEELTATLAWVRELVTMIHLAKFSGAPAARAEELVAQIAAAVEGISEVTAWPERQGDARSSFGGSHASEGFVRL